MTLDGLGVCVCVLNNEHLKVIHGSLKTEASFPSVKDWIHPLGLMNNPLERGKPSLNMPEIQFIDPD